MGILMSRKDKRQIVVIKKPQFRAPQPKRLSCEGYWDEKYIPKQGKTWSGKAQFLEAYDVLMTGVYREPYYEHLRRNRSRRNILLTRAFRGFAPSRIDDEDVGSIEFELNGQSWPGGYFDHYIKKYNVRPTEKFFHFVIREANRYSKTIKFSSSK